MAGKNLDKPWKNAWKKVKKANAFWAGQLVHFAWLVLNKLLQRKEDVKRDEKNPDGSDRYSCSD